MLLQLPSSIHPSIVPTHRNDEAQVRLQRPLVLLRDAPPVRGWVDVEKSVTSNRGIHPPSSAPRGSIHSTNANTRNPPDGLLQVWSQVLRVQHEVPPDLFLGGVEGMGTGNGVGQSVSQSGNAAAGLRRPPG